MGVSCKLRGSCLVAPSASVLSGPAVRPAFISVRTLSDTSSPEGNVVGVVPHGSDFMSPPSCPPSLPGITRLHRYYGCSDPCAEARLRGPFCSSRRAVPGILSPLAPRRSPRFTCSILPEPSVSNHPTDPRDRFDTYLLSVMGLLFAQVWASPFPSRLAGQDGRIEFAFASDDSVRLPLLPTPPRGDAVTVSYRPM